MAKPFEKGDDEILVYGVDWTAWLAGSADTIATATWVVPAGLTKVNDQASSTIATIKLSGGVVDEVYDVTCIITTTTSQETAERTIRVKIVEKKYK